MTKTASVFQGRVWQTGNMTGFTTHDFRTAPQATTLVVIPYFKAANWIRTCLDHLDANAEPHDILIVNDGGDDVLDVIQPQENLVVCRFERNVGLIGALNFAADFALSEGYRYYVRQDADDLSAPDRLRAQRVLIEKEGADLVVCGVKAVDQQGRLLWAGISATDQGSIKRAMAARNPTVHSTWFMRTDMFTRIGCYDERYKGAEDFELLNRIARFGKISVLSEQLVDYLVRPGSILSSSRGPAFQTLKVVLRYFEPRRIESYLGVMRAVLALLVSRKAKTRVRQLLGRLTR